MKIYAQATHIVGYLVFSSHFDIISVGKKIGDTMFGGLVFDGLEKSFCEEVPCIWIQRENKVLGFDIYIQQPGSNAQDLKNNFILTVSGSADHTQGTSFPISLDTYLKSLFLIFFPKGNGVLEIVEY